MTKDEALKLTLDWLESGNFVYPTELRTAIKEALAQPVQEPAFHGFMDKENCCVHICYTPWAPRMTDGKLPTAYYTTPPAAQPAPDYAWPTIADYEKEVGFAVNDMFKAAWSMARTTNDLFTQMENA